MKKIVVFLLAILSFTSCESVEADQILTVGNRYSISIPSFLKKVTTLNEDASLQYQHAWKNFYVIVIDEPKEEVQKAISDNNLTDRFANNLEGYKNLNLEIIKQGMSSPMISKTKDTNINKMPSKIITMTSKIEGTAIYYAIAYIEGKDRYYQITTWTLTNKENEYKEKMNRILYSFKEI